MTGAAGVLVRPLEGTVGWDMPYQFEFENGRKPDEIPSANYETITPGYFSTVGLALLEGRDFTARDGEHAEQVAIISRSLAERLRKQGRTPVGERLRFGKDPIAELHKVIGVVADARYRRVTETGDDIYVNHEQALAPTNYLVIRGTRSTAELTNLVRKTVASIDANQTIAGVATLQELIDRDTARHRFNMILLLWFAGCALVLAAAGIYSVIAETVASRTRELAIKLALGARGSRLIVEMLGGALFVVLIGEVAGALGAFGLGRLAQELLYAVSPSDPAVLGAVVAFLFFISFMAALLPAWRATLLDPRSSLQAE